MYGLINSLWCELQYTPLIEAIERKGKKKKKKRASCKFKRNEGLSVIIIKE